MKNNQISAADTARLKSLEEAIDAEIKLIEDRHAANMASFRVLGRVLTELRDSSLWLVYGVTWEDYIPSRFSFVYERADQIMRAYQVDQDIVTGLRDEVDDEGEDMPLPANERQLRPLSQVGAAMKDAKQRAQARTAVWVASVRAARAGGNKQAVPSGKVVGQMAASVLGGAQGGSSAITATALYDAHQDKLLKEVKALYAQLDAGHKQEFQEWSAKAGLNA